MYAAFVIICVCFMAALATEGASWYLIYRKEDYQHLKKTIESLQSKVDKLKDAAPPSLLASTDSSAASKKSKAKPSKDEKKLSMLQGDLKKRQQQLTGQRFKSTVLTTVTLIALYQLLSRTVGTAVVARLPFEPFPIVRGLSHRGLDGEDWYACSFGFVYALCQMAIRANVTRFFGFVPREESGLSSFMPTEEEESK